MTKRIDDSASRVGKISNFQYYVSRDIILTRVEDTEVVGKVAVSGRMKTTVDREVVHIRTSTPGALLQTEVGNDNKTLYYVAFETDNDNTLCFQQHEVGSDKKIYLVCDEIDGDVATIKYGDATYTLDLAGKGLKSATKGKTKRANNMGRMLGKMKGVTADETDNPHLLVKMKSKLKVREDYKKAKGRKVQVQ